MAWPAPKITIFGGTSSFCQTPDWPGSLRFPESGANLTANGKAMARSFFISVVSATDPEWFDAFDKKVIFTVERRNPNRVRYLLLQGLGESSMNIRFETFEPPETLDVAVFRSVQGSIRFEDPPRFVPFGPGSPTEFRRKNLPATLEWNAFVVVLADEHSEAVLNFKPRPTDDPPP